jgi:hypothetical protein
VAFSAGGDGGRRPLEHDDLGRWCGGWALNPFHGRCRVGQAFASEAIAECIRSGGVWKTESNMELLDLVSIPAAADWDASLTVERINL